MVTSNDQSLKDLGTLGDLRPRLTIDMRSMGPGYLNRYQLSVYHRTLTTTVLFQ